MKSMPSCLPRPLSKTVLLPSPASRERDVVFEKKTPEGGGGGYPCLRLPPWSPPPPPSSRTPWSSLLLSCAPPRNQAIIVPSGDCDATGLFTFSLQCRIVGFENSSPLLSSRVRCGGGGRSRGLSGLVSIRLNTYERTQEEDTPDGTITMCRQPTGVPDVSCLYYTNAPLTSPTALRLRNHAAMVERAPFVAERFRLVYN